METKKIIKEAEKALKKEISAIDELIYENSRKVLNAFHEVGISEIHFGTTTGYGYGDIGREAIEKVFARVLDAESALVRNQFISGSHALTVAFFAFLRPGDTMISITGEPYDTLHEVIGIKDNPSSLKSYGISYECIDLKDDDFDDESIIDTLKEKKYRLVHIQRSRGYSNRKSLTIDKVERIVKKIAQISPDSIIMVDNCYCEFVEEKTPLTVGAHIIVGSLIKNLGGGIAPNGAYIAGRKDLVELAAERLTLPGEGSEVGPTLGINKDFLRGLYMAPSAVGASLKLSFLASYILDQLGYRVSPRYDEPHADIVLMIEFNSPDKLISFTQGIQSGSAIDAFATPEPTEMPGYDDHIIMASGSFIQGSSIEISCDGPLRPPYNAYLQGSLTYEYAKLALEKALAKLED